VIFDVDISVARVVAKQARLMHCGIVLHVNCATVCLCVP